jgi:hypothetical protein
LLSVSRQAAELNDALAESFAVFSGRGRLPDVIVWHQFVTLRERPCCDNGTSECHDLNPKTSENRVPDDSSVHFAAIALRIILFIFAHYSYNLKHGKIF